MTRARSWALAAACVAALWAPEAGAHARSVSWSAWTIRGADVEVRARVARMDLDAVSPGMGARPSEALGVYLAARLRAESAEGPCVVAPGSVVAEGTDEDDVVRAWRLRCPGGPPVRIASDLLVDRLPAHVHLASLLGGDQAVAERVLTAGERTWSLGPGGFAGDAPSSGLGEFVLLGARHVAGGADHLVFLLALLAGAASLRALVAVVTGFTAGHSATLALAVLGRVHPDPACVEALIGASIAVVAVENVWLEGRDPWMPWGLLAALVVASLAGTVHASIGPLVLAGLASFVGAHFLWLARVERPSRLRWTIAALFGGVHGLAFSNVLAVMHLPRARLVPSLFGFNLGVELAQVAAVALAWPLWRRLTRGVGRAPALEMASAAALGLGAFWFVERAFGG